MFCLIYQRGADINAKNLEGETPLHGAALKNHHDMMERLIEFGANVRHLSHLEINKNLHLYRLTWQITKEKALLTGLLKVVKRTPFLFYFEHIVQISGTANRSLTSLQKSSL